MTGMRNVTTQERQSTEISWKGTTVGLDLSDNYSSFCVLDPSGEIMEEGRLRTAQASFAERFGRMSPCRVVLEVGTHSPWVSRQLAEQGHEVIVANPRRVRLIADSTRKNDRSDAETLARLGRIDPRLLSPIVHRSEQAQAGVPPGSNWRPSCGTCRHRKQAASCRPTSRLLECG